MRIIVNIEDLLSISIAAKCAGVSTSTIRRWLKAGRLDAVEICGHRFVRGYQLRMVLRSRAARPQCRKED